MAQSANHKRNWNQGGALLCLFVLATAIGAVACATTGKTAFEAARDAGRAKRAGDIPTFLAETRKALRRAPGHPELLYDMARASALAGDVEAARHWLARAATVGSAWPALAETDLDRLLERPGSAALRRRIEDLSSPRGKARVAFTLTQRDLYPEGIACDPNRGDFFIGSTYHRKIVRIRSGGRVEDFVPFAADGIGGVLGLAVDSSRGRLCAAHTMAPIVRDYDAARSGQSGVTCFDLASGRQLAAAMIGGPGDAHLINAITFEPDGSLLATDSEAGQILRWPLGDAAWVPVYGQDPNFSYPNGITLDSGGNDIFVAHVEGVSVLTRSKGKSSHRFERHLLRLDARQATPLNGIDGLTSWRDTLLAVQPSTRHILRLTLDPSRRRVLEVEELLANHPSFDLPTTATIFGDTLHLIANSQLRRRNSDGTIPLEKLQPPIVLALDLR